MTNVSAIDLSNSNDSDVSLVSSSESSSLTVDSTALSDSDEISVSNSDDSNNLALSNNSDKLSAVSNSDDDLELLASSNSSLLADNEGSETGSISDFISLLKSAKKSNNYTVNLDKDYVFSDMIIHLIILLLSMV